MVAAALGLEVGAREVLLEEVEVKLAQVLEQVCLSI